MDVLTVIKKFDGYLAEKSYEFAGVIIGGAALHVLKVTNRATRDIDFLSPSLDEQVLLLAEEFRVKFPELSLQKDWLNNGPINLQVDLPTGWQGRVLEIYKGNALTLSTLGRSDLLKTKLFAYCDRDIDLRDCIDLAPSVEELDESMGWLIDRDTNKHWPERVKSQIEFLKGKLK